MLSLSGNCFLYCSVQCNIVAIFTVAVFFQISEDTRTVYSEPTEEEKKEEIGVPHIIVDCANKTFSVPTITKNDFLPSMSEVSHLLAIFVIMLFM